MMQYDHMRAIFQTYAPISDATWQMLEPCLSLKTFKKGETLYPFNEIPSHFGFLHKGLVRAYVMDEQGNEYNKKILTEGRFHGCMSALLENKPSFLCIEAMENCDVVEIDFKHFRQVLFQNHELMTFHINYLEKHWLLEKEPKEIGYLQFEAKHRYQQFLKDFHDIIPRIPQYHIASFLGITPTQLSRIRKELN